jgi:alkylated DNA nucleotide flippase Atl1
MIKGPGRFRNYAIVVGLVIAALLFVWIFISGAVNVLHQIIEVFSHARLPSFSIPGWLADFFTDRDASGTRHVSAEKIGILATALFTAVLGYFTYSMGLASRREVAGDAPLLRIYLLVSPRTQESTEAKAPNTPVKRETREVREREIYRSELVSDDNRDFSGEMFKPLDPPRFLVVRIDNVQTAKPFAVARDIKIRVAVTHRGTGKMPRGAQRVLVDLHQESDPASLSWTRVIERDVEVRIIAPDCAITEPIFNLAALEECEVAVTDVTYFELRRNKARKAAYGDLFLTLKGDGTVEPKEGYYQPEGWEMP